jgi:hypothetical protein
MDEILLGFQLRVTLSQLKQWDSERRETYLLRENIKHPLSIDRAVWPEYDNKDVLSSFFSDYCVGVYCAPNGLNIYNIKTPTLLDQISDHAETILIGLTIINDTVNHAQELKSKHSILDIPYSFEHLLRSDWACLGYDVADYWLYSGLMNCGYNPNHKTDLSKRFANALNEYGLFMSTEIAQEFRIYCESNIKEHMPFAVYGLWWKSSL